MPVKVSVETDIAKIGRMYRRQKKELPRVIVQALNKTGQQVESAGAKATAKEMGLRVKDARAAIKRRKAFKGRLVTEIAARGRPLNLARFAARPARRGVSAKAWGKRKIYKGTFFVNDQRTVMKRATRRRLPIVPVYGPGIAPTFASARLNKITRGVIAERWPINLRQSVNFMLARTRAR